MTDTHAAWADQILAGNRRAIARGISAVENGDPAASPLLKILFPRSRRARLIGVTGSPGAGKSTLVEKLALEYRQKGNRVGILAVDPTSPFTGGAILGDRIRMQALAGDPEVFLRSMATRGQLGGLAPATQDVAAILEAAGCSVILIETVGVGQDEIEVARLADMTLLLLVPGMGDDVQTFKAGVMEIADVFVINKADRPGADRVEQELAAMLAITPQQGTWKPPVLKTVATEAQGVKAVCQAVEQFADYMRLSGVGALRDREKWRARLMEMLRQEAFLRTFRKLDVQGAVDAAAVKVVERKEDPRSVVEALLTAARESSHH